MSHKDPRKLDIYAHMKADQEPAGLWRYRLIDAIDKVIDEWQYGMWTDKQAMNRVAEAMQKARKP